MRARGLLVVGVKLLVMVGCAPTHEGAPAGGPHAVPGGDGKADNYISTNAREFELTGTAHVPLPEDFHELTDDQARQQRLDEVVLDRLERINRAVKSHVREVLREHNDGTHGEDARWFTYFRRDAAEVQSADVLEDGYAQFDFRIQLVGSRFLMSKLAPGSPRTFEVEVPYDDGEPGQLRIEIAGSESRNAFPRYDELFRDGVYDIAVHFGGDYNDERFDLETARWLVELLIDDGWSNPAVAEFDDLGFDSPPFTRMLQIEGNPVEVRVSIYHADMDGPGEQEQLGESMRQSLATADVVIYSGHAGSNAGFILDYSPRYEIDNDDFTELPLADKYQIYVFDGCQTYRTYVDDLMDNPRKTFENTDIVTTVNTTPFSAGYQTLYQFVYWLTLTNDSGHHLPVSWKGLLRGLNDERYGNVYYGVHGVDQDPQLNPHASEGIMCRACSRDADCGAGGNLCLQAGSGAGCGVGCTTDTACGPGYRCARILDYDEYFYIPKQCVPTDGVCG